MKNQKENTLLLVSLQKLPLLVGYIMTTIPRKKDTYFFYLDGAPMYVLEQIELQECGLTSYSIKSIPVEHDLYKLYKKELTPTLPKPQDYLANKRDLEEWFMGQRIKEWELQTT